MTNGSPIGRTLTALLLLTAFGSAAAVALIGAGLPGWLAMAIPVAGTAASIAWCRSLPAAPIALARRHPLLASLWAIVFCAAAFQMARASTFAQDVSRRDCSVAPADTFRSQHNCLTAYAEAVRFARNGGSNIYDENLYRPGGVPRRLGPLTIDPYHYPPPFLLLPAAIHAIAPDFFEMRRVWFGVQVLLLAGAMLGVAAWIGGATGARVALSAVTFWALPTTYMGLQTGNFQSTAIALAMIGVVFAANGRYALGGGLLAYAAGGKVFPSMLVLHVVATRRWRTMIGIVLGGIALAVATALVFGVEPYIDFLRDELPQLASGSAFPQTEWPSTWAVNMSVYGLTVKLRALGLDVFDPSAGKQVARLYALLLAALAVVAGLRAGVEVDERSRFARATAWLGILNLASFASPFVGGSYGPMGTTWLLAVLAGGAASGQRRAIWLVALALSALIPWVLPSPRTLPEASAGMLALSLLWQVGAIGVNTWCAWPVTLSVTSPKETTAAIA